MLCVLLVTLALGSSQPEGFPLDKGLRWTYECGLRGTVTVDVVGMKTVNGEEVSVLSVVGEWLSSYSGGNIFVTSEDGGFAMHGSHIERYDEPLMFVQPGLETGAKWHSETVGRRTFRDRRMAFDATVLGRETVPVPAGEFDAWKIGVSNDRDAPATPRDFTAWFAPGIGFVKYEYRYNSYPWRGFLDAPIVCRLKEFRELPYGYPIEYPELSGQQQDETVTLLSSFKSDEAERTRSPEEGLLGLGSGVIPALLEYLDREEASHVQVRIEKLLQDFATIEIIASASQARSRIGKPLPVEFRIRNVGCAPIPVVPAIDHSDRGRRYPSYIIEVRSPDGRVLNVKAPIGCGNIDPLREQHVVILQPGEELNPFPSRGTHFMLYRWKPVKPGVYTIRCIYEWGVGDPSDEGSRFLRWTHWPSAPVLSSLILRMPHGRIASNEVSVIVEE